MLFAARQPLHRRPARRCRTACATRRVVDRRVRSVPSARRSAARSRSACRDVVCSCAIKADAIGCRIDPIRVRAPRRVRRVRCAYAVSSCASASVPSAIDCRSTTLNSTSSRRTLSPSFTRMRLDDAGARRKHADDAVVGLEIPVHRFLARVFAVHDERDHVRRRSLRSAASVRRSSRGCRSAWRRTRRRRETPTADSRNSAACTG